jgi:hypothetical protein
MKIIVTSKENAGKWNRKAVRSSMSLDGGRVAIVVSADKAGDGPADHVLPYVLYKGCGAELNVQKALESAGLWLVAKSKPAPKKKQAAKKKPAAKKK